MESANERLNEIFSENRPFAEAFKCLFESASDAIYILDKKGNFLIVNRKAEELTGFKREDFIGKPFRKAIAMKSLPKAARAFLDVIRGKEIRQELELKTATNKIITVEVTSKPLTINGKIIGTLGIVRDISERVRMENDLKEANRQLKILYEKAMEGIVVVDPEENITLVNKAFANMLGYKEDELLGVNLRRFVDKKGFQEIKKQTENRRKGEVSRYEFCMFSKDGNPHVIQVSASPLWNKNGDFIGALAITMDVTERRKMEDVLRESEEKFRKIFQNASDSIIYLDVSGRIVDVNEKAIQIFGGSKKELVGKHFIKLGVVSPADIPKLLSNFARILAGKPGYTNVKIKNRIGQERYLECSSSIMTREGKINGILVIARDVTERMQMQKKLEEYSQQLEALVEKRTSQLEEAQEKLIKNERLAAIGQVAAMVGHDLRNPLTGIAGATYYLKKKLNAKTDKTIKEMLTLIEENIEYSNKIISDLLGYSREIKLELKETSPKSILENALSFVEIPKGISILKIIEDKPKIIVDVEKLKRVFINIIKNAIDAMPKGGTLTIKSSEKTGKLEITFTDTGIGMPKDVLENIWTPFFTTKARGLGLGLPICKRIIEAHGGNISAESTVGKGTTFSITIPLIPKLEGGEKIWVTAPEYLSSTMTKA